VGGPIALLADGDVIRIDADAGTLCVDLDEAQLASRRAAWQPPSRAPLAGVLEKYERLVGPACNGAVTHAGAVEWPYA
jgi:dihydroxy-acid dehydratase